MTSIWRSNRIGEAPEGDPDALRPVDLSGLTRKGLTAPKVKALFEFERGILGTSRALIRACKRAEGTPLPLPYKVEHVAGGIPKALASFYEGEWLLVEDDEDES